jgi:hypothetical protein
MVSRPVPFSTLAAVVWFSLSDDNEDEGDEFCAC